MVGGAFQHTSDFTTGGQLLSFVDWLASHHFWQLVLLERIQLHVISPNEGFVTGYIYLFNQSNSLCLNLSVGLSNNVNWQCYRSWKYLNTLFCYNAAFNIVWLFPWAFSSFCLANHKTNTLITGAPICTHPCAKKQQRANNIAHVSTVDLLMKSTSSVLELFIIKIYSILLPEQFNQ